MRTLIVPLAALLVALAATPPATAAHCCGPCTHEWFEIVAQVPSDYRQGGFSQALGNAGARAGGCLDNGIGWELCEIVNCEVIGLP